MYFIPLIGNTNGNKDPEKAKVPACKAWNKENPSFNKDLWVANGGWIGAVYTDKEVIVDIDNKEFANRVINLGLLGCQINTTPHGVHLIYNSGAVKGVKNKSKVICALGIEIDYRVAKKGYIVYPSGQPDRQIIQEGIISDLPQIFHPTNKKGFDLVTDTQEGGRNSALNSWGWFLGKNKFDIGIISYTNQMLSDPLPDEEIVKIIGSLAKGVTEDKEEPKTSRVKLILEEILEKETLIFDGFEYRQYNNLFWDAVSIHAIEKMIYEYGATSMSQMNNIKSMLKAAILQENTAKNYKRKLNLLNGVLDIDTKELKEHDKNLYFNYIINSEYCQKDTSRITEFITNIIGAYQIDTFKKMCGKILLQDNQKCEAAFFWLGTNRGGNGKGTLLRLINSLFDHATVNVSLDKLDDRFGLGNIEGKLLILDSDFNNALISQTERFKKLVSGESLELEMKNVQNKKEVEFQGTILVLTNYLPTISVSGSGGFYRRSNLIKFEKNFYDLPERDANIKDKILEYKTEFLNFCLEGLELLKKDNYVISSETETTAEWELSNDPLRQWMIEEYKEGEGDIIVDELFEHFNRWVYAYGEKKKSRSQFLKAVARIFPNTKYTRKRINGVRTYCISNLVQLVNM
jgi:P4 family phage/plasmid primase-like protien